MIDIVASALSMPSFSKNKSSMDSEISPHAHSDGLRFVLNASNILTSNIQAAKTSE